MPTLKGITVQILCDGVPLEEYSTLLDQNDHSAVSCWIASEADKIFHIHYKSKTDESCSWSCHLFCDGHAMRAKLFCPTVKSHTVERARNGENLHVMMFSDLPQTESQELAKNGLNPLLGTICVKFWRISSQWKPSDKKAKTIEIDEAPVHESKKLLGTHRIKLGNAEPAGNSLVKPTYLDAIPYSVFTFYYRPRSLLQAIGHIPPSPARPAHPLKRSASVVSDSASGSESDGEAERLAAQVYVLQQKIEKRRQEREEKRASKRVKREQLDIVVPPTAKGEVIDLTYD